MSLRLLVVAMLITTAAALGMIAYRAASPPVLVTMQQVPLPEAKLPMQALSSASYIVASRPLPAGTLTRDDDFKVVTVRPVDVPEGSIAMGPDVLPGIRGALVRRYLDAGAPIGFADILRPRDRGFLAAVLLPGSRAVSIGVDAVSGVAGLIWPGDRVDVILTQEREGAIATISRRFVSETVLTDIGVIAVDQEIVQGAAGTSAAGGKVARTVTLQVDRDQAERLTVAQRLGHLALAIRAMIDTPGTLLGRQPVYSSDVSPSLAGAGESRASHVHVIHGDKVTEFTFQ
jgi:pilus assembly protein CpaB